MATKKLISKSPTVTIENLKNEIQLLKYQFAMFELSNPYSGGGNTPSVINLRPHISYSLIPDSRIVRVIGETFSIPSFLNKRLQHARLFIELSHVYSFR